jgi:hypothetical protein
MCSPCRRTLRCSGGAKRRPLHRMVGLHSLNAVAGSVAATPTLPHPTGRPSGGVDVGCNLLLARTGRKPLAQ